MLGFPAPENCQIVGDKINFTYRLRTTRSSLRGQLRKGWGGEGGGMEILHV